MYICQDCNCSFFEPARHREDYGFEIEYGHVSAYQAYTSCPYCGSENYVSAMECCECMEVFARCEMMLTDDCNYICSECYSKLEENEE